MQQRERILEAAAEVVGRRGYQAASIREIAVRAGVAVGTIYIYFAGKRELLLAFVDRLAAEQPQPVDRATVPGSREGFERFVMHELKFLRQNRLFAAPVLTEAVFDDELSTIVKRQLTRPGRSRMREALAACGAEDPAAAALPAWNMVMFNAVFAPAIGQELSAAKLASAIWALAGGFPAKIRARR